MFMITFFLGKNNVTWCETTPNRSIKPYPWFLGNSGGYLGLFLGYAVLNVPELLNDAFDWLYKKWNTRKSEASVAPSSTGAQYIVPTDQIV